MKRYWVIAPYNSEREETFNKAWEYDLKNGTIAVGWIEMGDILGLNEEEIKKRYLEVYKVDIPVDRHSFRKFYNEISIGDIVIARKGRKKIIGIGEVTATAFYDENKGKERIDYRTDRIYPNFLGIKWQEELIEFDRQVFPMFTLYEITEDKYNLFIQGKGTVGLEIKSKVISQQDDRLSNVKIECPEWLEVLIKDIETLKTDHEHKERAHESLVESFYELLGFKRFIDIKHRQGRIDISVEIDGETVVVNEVKKDWHLSYRDKDTIKQAYNYSLESGARFVVITNGDYYAIFDKDKGRSYEANFIGEFQLSKLEKRDLELIDSLRRDNIAKPL